MSNAPAVPFLESCAPLIALFAARCEFLFDDWLWLIDPAGKH